VKDFTKSYHI